MNLEIRCRLFGGIGNQIFQYATGFRVASLLDGIFVVDTRWLESQLSHSKSDIRTLQIYNPRGEITRQSHGDLNLTYNKILSKLASKNKRLGRFLHMYSKEFVDLAEIQKYENFVELSGYFQNSWSVEGALWDIPNFSLDLKKKSDTLVNAINSLEDNFVAVHIRRGDYLNKNSIHLVLTSDYYKDAIRLVQANSQAEIHFLIFSDDPSFAKYLIPSGLNYTMAEKFKLDPVEEMHLMSYASSFIIANSTFSFWPAISSLINPQVIAPSNWFKSRTIDMAQLYPKRWEIIYS